MISFVLAAFMCLQGGTPTAVDPPSAPGTVPQGQVLSNDRRLDYKMRTSRAERSHAEMVESANEILDLATGLSERLGRAPVVDSESRKTLDKIRKLAKRVRSDAGGYGGHEMQEEPKTPADAALALGQCARALSVEMEDASRFEVNSRVITLCGDIEYLCEYLKRGRRP